MKSRDERRELEIHLMAFERLRERGGYDDLVAQVYAGTMHPFEFEAELKKRVTAEIEDVEETLKREKEAS
jgi:hypothetical protein